MQHISIAMLLFVAIIVRLLCATYFLCLAVEINELFLKKIMS